MEVLSRCTWITSMNVHTIYGWLTAIDALVHDEQDERSAIRSRWSWTTGSQIYTNIHVTSIPVTTTVVRMSEDAQSLYYRHSRLIYSWHDKDIYYLLQCMMTSGGFHLMKSICCLRRLQSMWSVNYSICGSFPTVSNRKYILYRVRCANIQLAITWFQLHVYLSILFIDL